MTERGNPKLMVRLDHETLERAKEAFPSVKGRSGGVSLAVRRLLYFALGVPMPRQYGELGRNDDVDDFENEVRKATSLCAGQFHALKLRANRLLAGSYDVIDRTRILSLIGFIAVLESFPSDPKQLESHIDHMRARFLESGPANPWLKRCLDDLAYWFMHPGESISLEQALEKLESICSDPEQDDFDRVEALHLLGSMAAVSLRLR